MDLVVLGLFLLNGDDLGFFGFWGFQLLFVKGKFSRQTKSRAEGFDTHKNVF